MSSDSGAVLHSCRNLNELVPEVEPICLLFTFSGPEGRQEGFRELAITRARTHGFPCTVECFDIINDVGQDLADQHAFERLANDIDSGKYDGSLSSPPCSTFSDPDGPRPLRGHSGRDRYGLRGLLPYEAEKVKLETLLAIRAADISRRFSTLGRPWLTESPPQVDGKPSLFGLDEWTQLIADTGARRTSVAQYMFGATHETFIEIQGDSSIPMAPETCTHPPRWWRLPPSGRWIWGPHAPLSGRVLAVPAEEWYDGLYNFTPAPNAPFLARATASYPDRFDEFLANHLVDKAIAARKQRTSAGALAQSQQLVRVGRWQNTLVRAGDLHGCRNLTERPPTTTRSTFQPQVSFSNPLRGPRQLEKKQEENEKALGGMRGPARAVSRMPVAAALGTKLRIELDKVISADPSILDRCQAAIGSEHPNAGPTHAQVLAARTAIAGVLGIDVPEPFTAKSHDTELCGELLEAWTRAARDPDEEAASWPRLGAPAGVLEHPAQVGVFPDATEPADHCDPEDLEQINPEERHSYASVEHDPFAYEELQRLVGLSYLDVYNDYPALERAVGGSPIISKFGMIIK